MNDNEAERLREGRLIHELARAYLVSQGIPVTNNKSYDEMVASGELKAAECQVLGKLMLDPGLLDQGNPGSGDKS